MTTDPSVADPELYDTLDGQVALVTGANRGIGAEIARQLRDVGATVYAGSRSLSNETPDGTERILLDVTQEGDIEAAVDGIFDEVGRLDVLVNNAGIIGPDGDIVAAPTAEIDRTLGVNLRGPMLLCKHAVPLLLQNEGGRIVNVSSGMGAIVEEQSGGSPAYRVSKTGLNGLTAYLEGEYGDDGLLANSVCPGWVRTELGAKMLESRSKRARKRPSGSRDSHPRRRRGCSGGTSASSTGNPRCRRRRHRPHHSHPHHRRPYCPR